LCEAPLLRTPALRFGEPREELRPLHAGLDFDQSALHVEAEQAVELSDVDQDAVGGEGLSAHRVAAASDAHGAPLAFGGGDRAARASSVSGSTMRSTRVGLSCECRSLTRNAWGLRPCAGVGPGGRQATSFTNSRRSIMSPPCFRSGQSKRQRPGNGDELALFEQPVGAHAEQAHRPARGVGAIEERQGARGDLGGSHVGAWAVWLRVTVVKSA